MSATGFHRFRLSIRGVLLAAMLVPCGNAEERIPTTEPSLGRERAVESVAADELSLAAEIAALRARVDELERQPIAPVVLDPFAFQQECSGGIHCGTQDGRVSANLGGRVEMDWLWITGDESLESNTAPFEDGVFFRRARIHAAGTLFEMIDYYAEYEFAPVDNIVFQDVWMQLRGIPVLGHIRTGHLKVPFGLENETSAKHLTFLERSAVHDAFQQEYDPGIMFWNTVLDDDFRYAAAFLRFDPRESGISFGDGEYSFATRLSGALWHNDDDSLLLHAGASYRRIEVFDSANSLSGFRFRARPEIRRTPRFLDTGFFEGDHGEFVGLETAAVLGSFSVQAEYVHCQVPDAIAGTNLGDATFSGYYIAASYFLTGEHRPYSRSNGGFGRIRPKNNIATGEGWRALFAGAWEAKARYTEVDLRAAGIDGGELSTLTLGLNWYLIPNSKVMADYILADRTGNAFSGQAHLFGLRFNVEF